MILGWKANGSPSGGWIAHIDINGTKWQTTLDGAARSFEFWNVKPGSVMTVSGGGQSKSITYAGSDTPPPAPGENLRDLTLTKNGANKNGDRVIASWKADANPQSGWIAHININGTKWQTTLPGSDRSFEFWNVKPGSVITITGAETPKSVTYRG